MTGRVVGHDPHPRAPGRGSSCTNASVLGGAPDGREIATRRHSDLCRRPARVWPPRSGGLGATPSASAPRDLAVAVRPAAPAARSAGSSPFATLMAVESPIPAFGLMSLIAIAPSKDRRAGGLAFFAWWSGRVGAVALLLIPLRRTGRTVRRFRRGFSRNLAAAGRRRSALRPGRSGRPVGRRRSTGRSAVTSASSTSAGPRSPTPWSARPPWTPPASGDGVDQVPRARPAAVAAVTITAATSSASDASRQRSVDGRRN